ncbi:glycosyltransferase family 4 protein [Mesorhizobium sp. L-8-3]|uniref:glycosyltransferase family 4 protein n=1 Tax=Mesorhizobium sp. L-8-3 TaxID=2744522 RepID=UPI001FD410CB|nr:glycosyltransferase family 4 protein [Mesorhizobium sp. L-8-3]
MNGNNAPMTPQRLALISSQAFSLANFRGTLISSLVGRGVEVFALAPDYDDTTRSAVVALGAKPIDYPGSRTGLNPVRDLLDTLRLALLLRRLRVDVSLGYFIKPVTFGTIAAWLAGVPRRFAMIEGLGYVFIGADEQQGLARRALRGLVKRLYRFALARARKVLFLNDDDIAEFKRAGLVAADKAVKLGPIGVDLDRWLPAPPVLDPVTFVMTARLLREKGVVEYAGAARMVKARHPRTRFILLGGLDSNPGVIPRAEADAWVQQGILEWPGHVPVEPWLAQASVYVLPSYREGVPRSTQEAMAMARPVITTDVPGCRETVQDGENGFLVPARDTEALAAAMLRFVERPDLIPPMGQASRRIAEARFDAKRADALIIDTVLGE